MIQWWIRIKTVTNHLPVSTYHLAKHPEVQNDSDQNVVRILKWKNSTRIFQLLCSFVQHLTTPTHRTLNALRFGDADPSQPAHGGWRLHKKWKHYEKWNQSRAKGQGMSWGKANETNLLQYIVHLVWSLLLPWLQLYCYCRRYGKIMANRSCWTENALTTKSSISAIFQISSFLCSVPKL